MITQISCAMPSRWPVQTFAVEVVWWLECVVSLPWLRCAVSPQGKTSSPSVTCPGLSDGPSTSACSARGLSSTSAWRCRRQSTSSLRQPTNRQVQWLKPPTQKTTLLYPKSHSGSLGFFLQRWCIKDRKLLLAWVNKIFLARLKSYYQFHIKLIIRF